MTPSATSNSALTVLDHLIKHLRARSVQIGGQERPAAILWTDPKAEWTPVIPTIQTRLDELLVLGDLAPDMRTGPAIWIRCLVDRTLDEPALPSDRSPIVYLPGVARQELRAGERMSPRTAPPGGTDVPGHAVVAAQRKRLGRDELPDVDQDAWPRYRAE